MSAEAASHLEDLPEMTEEGYTNEQIFNEIKQTSWKKMPSRTVAGFKT